MKGSISLTESLLENIPDMIFVKDAKELRFVQFNRAGEELLGYNRKELIGKNDYDFFPKEQADFFTKNDRTVLISGRLLDIPEEPIHTKNRGLRYLHTKKIPIFDEEGRPLYLLGISEDITEEKKAKERIRTYVNIVNNIQLAVLIWRLEDINDLSSFRLIDANPASSDITGTNMRRFVGKTMAESFPHFLKTSVPAQFREVIKKNRVIDIGEIHYGDENVPASDWALKAFPLPVNCVGVVYENVSKRKNIERKIISILNREQLRIGHDLHDGLGQDLTAVSLLTKVFEKKLKRKTNISQLREISNMVNLCIDKAKRLARGLHPVELEQGGLASALQEFCTNIKTLYGVTCRFDLPREIQEPSMEVSNQLYRIAQEAVHNAIKHAKAKEIVINLEAKGKNIQLTITDDGVGIPKMEQKRDRGMGLAIMDYRARMIGGTLTITKQGKKGTSVSCLIA